MATPPKRAVIINEVRFIEVPNATVSGKIYNYEEAVAYTEGKSISTA